MVAKGKTYGKKKGRDLASLFTDLAISPTKPGKRELNTSIFGDEMTDRK